MPRLKSKGRSVARLEGWALAALLHGTVPRIAARGHQPQFDTRELATLRSLWFTHREEITAQFQEKWPGLMPFGYWKFEATEPRPDAEYQAAYQRHAQQIGDRSRADRAARDAVGQPMSDRQADYQALSRCPAEGRDQLRREQYARLGIETKSQSAATSAQSPINQQ